MDSLIKVFSGPESTLLMLKKRLEEEGIDALIKNDSSYAFWGAAPQIVDLYIQEDKMEKAQSVIQDFDSDSLN